MKFVDFLRRWPWVASAAALCLIAAGIVGAVTLLGNKETVAASMQEKVEVSVAKPQVVPQAEPEPAETVPDTAAISEPAELLPSVVSPLDGTTVTVFSMTELLYDQTMADWRTHDGIDIQAGDGDAVKTAAGGTVRSVKNDELMGTTVIIDHSDGYVTTYASLQEKPPVNEGQSVCAGDIIGYVGTTAAAELTMGPHLHFSVSKDGRTINPEEYVK